MRCVIMQPTYLPWTGYFDLIDQSDVFVLLDTVQFEKQSWQQRNRVKTPQGVVWLTVPVLQDLQNRISEVEINNKVVWQRKHWGTLEQSYRRACHFAEFAPALHTFYAREWASLAELNTALISEMSAWLGLRPNLIRSSELPPIAERREEMIVRICQHFGADEYLSPPGARDYLADDTAFTEAGIRLRFQTYEHPVYPQLHGDFVPYLSALDLLLNAGGESLHLLRSGRRDSVSL
jgi:hypothetical protein